jgi:uncharacterized phiE125 gp8 family phage protein
VPFVLVTPPATEPVSLSEAEAHLRLDDDDTDVVLRLITSARQFVEKYLGRALVAQTWDLAIDEFPAGAIVLAKGRLASVTSVTYRDADGAEQTLATSAYQVDDVSVPGRVLPAPGTSWPETEADRVNAVRVRFVAGYGAAADVPGPIKAAMLLLIGHLYEHRESEITGTIATAHQLGIDALLSPYRIHGWGA